MHRKYLGIANYLQSTRLLIIVLAGLFLIIDLSCTQYTKAENEVYPFDYGYGPYRRKVRYPISKGNLRVSGNFDFYKPFGENVSINANSLLISPSIVYFATNGLAVGFDASYHYGYIKDESYNVVTHEYGIMPKVYYFRALSENVYPYITGGAGYRKSYQRYISTYEQYDASFYEMQYNLGAGTTFIFSSGKSISIEAGCLTTTPDEFKYNIFYTKIGFDFFIPLTKTIILN
jgi:hypothetical protein